MVHETQGAVVEELPLDDWLRCWLRFLSQKSLWWRVWQLELHQVGGETLGFTVLGVIKSVVLLGFTGLLLAALGVLQGFTRIYESSLELLAFYQASFTRVYWGLLGFCQAKLAFHYGLGLLGFHKFLLYSHIVNPLVPNRLQYKENRRQMCHHQNSSKETTPLRL